MKLKSTSLVVLAIGSSVLLSACQHGGEHEAMRAEIAAVRAIADGADQKATAAQAEAQQAAAAADQAAQEAQTASEKADRIFRANLRK